MTLHLVDIGRADGVRPTRLRSIVDALHEQGADPMGIVAVGTATEHARAAGLRFGRSVVGRPSANRLARWTQGHGRVVAWGDWRDGVPDGVAWAERARTSWRAVAPSSWSPGPGAPLLLWCGEPAGSVCAFDAVQVAARLALLGTPARVVVAAGAARLDRARDLARDMGVGESLIVLDDRTSLATVAGHAALAIAAPTHDGVHDLATHAAVPECLAAFAAAGTACMAPHGIAREEWVIDPSAPGVSELALCIARVLGAPDALVDAGRRARAAAAGQHSAVPAP